MLRYKCLVLDHDDTVVQSDQTLAYPCFVQTMARLRPDVKLTLEQYLWDCNSMGFLNLCREKYGFTQQELAEEYEDWQRYIRAHIPDPFPGIENIIHKQKQLGGLVCVVSHSTDEIIRRDYRTHFGMEPDAIFSCDLPEHQQKPNAYPLEAIMSHYRLNADELLVIDDSMIGYDMAHQCGIQSVFAAWGKQAYAAQYQQMQEFFDYTFLTPADFEAFLFA